MSFILDALRKSEQERQRNKAPGIADMQAPRKKGNRSIWIPLVALLAGLNLALLAVLWYAGELDPEPEVAADMVQSRPAPTPDNPARPAANPLPADAGSDETDFEPSRFATISPPVPSVPEDNDGDDSTRMITVTEAMLDGSLSITPLHLDLHVYSDNPKERFVFINTNRYAEGERLSEGPTVKRINDEGVILNYQGRDFLLSRE
jgi:general secretion pathway protein B